MPIPPEFPFARTGRVVYSSRGLYGLAALLVLIVALFGALFYSYASINSTTTIVIACGFLSVLLAMAGWCIYWAGRVRRWEREYERVMGHKFHA